MWRKAAPKPRAAAAGVEQTAGPRGTGQTAVQVRGSAVVEVDDVDVVDAFVDEWSLAKREPRMITAALALPVTTRLMCTSAFLLSVPLIAAE